MTSYDQRRPAGRRFVDVHSGATFRKVEQPQVASTLTVRECLALLEEAIKREGPNGTGIWIAVSSDHEMQSDNIQVFGPFPSEFDAVNAIAGADFSHDEYDGAVLAQGALEDDGWSFQPLMGVDAYDPETGMARADKFVDQPGHVRITREQE